MNDPNELLRRINNLETSNTARIIRDYIDNDELEDGIERSSN